MPVPLPLILDEDSRGRGLWKAIQRHNTKEPTEPLDIIRVGDAGAPSIGTLDNDLLKWAIGVNRVIITQDVGTLVGYHNQIVAAGATTPGLFVLRRGFGISVLVEELVLHAYCLTPIECASAVWYLPAVKRNRRPRIEN
jgi:hypothetical protein